MTPQAIRDGFDAAAQRQADARPGRRGAQPLRGRLAGRHQRHAGDDRVQLARRRLLPHHRRPRADADAVDRGRARGEDPQARGARLLGGAGDASLAEAGEYEGKWFDPKWKKNADDAEQRADRLWTEAEAQAIAEAVRGQAGDASPRSPSRARRRSPLLYDLTTLQREANGALRLLGQDHAVARAGAVREAQGADLPAHRLARAARGLPARSSSRRWTMLAEETCPGRCARSRRTRKQALDERLRQADASASSTTPRSRTTSRSSRRCRRPRACPRPRPSSTTWSSSASWRCSSRRAEFLVTTRITQVVRRAQLPDQRQGAGQAGLAGGLRQGGAGRTDAEPGAGASPARWCAPRASTSRALKTRPPARYTEATLLAAMEGAGKLIDDDELREAMQEKGLGTPATRAAIIEGLIYEKYMLREGRELIPTAKAFQLMTLLRGLGVEDLTQARAHRRLGVPARRRWSTASLTRDAFMREIAEMTRAHRQEGQGVRPRHDPRRLRDADDAVPQLRRRGQGELPPLRLHRQAGRRAKAAASRSARSPAGRTFELAEVEQFLRDKKIGPLEGFRSKAGWPFTAELVLVYDDEIEELEARVRLRRGRARARTIGEPVDFSGQEPLGPCPKCRGRVFEYGTQLRLRARRAGAEARRPATSRAARSSCSSRSRASR